MRRIDSLLEKIPIRPLLVLPLALYLGVTLYWQCKGIYKLVGDEAHYLLIAESLIRDGDVQVKNNYSSDTPVQRAAPVKLSDPVHSGPHLFNEYSRHNPGLPLLLAIPYFIAGIAGAKIFMVLLAGFWPLLIYRTLFRITESKHWSALVACTVGLGLPFLAAANQIFPDLLGGMIIFYLAEKIFRIADTKVDASASRVGDLWIGILIAFLPWLHLRLVAPAFLLLLGYIYVLTDRSRRQHGRPILRQWLVPAIVLGGSLILMAVYNLIAFSNPLGPYGSHSWHFHLRDNAMIFLGLHWDQTQGMFMQQPLLLLSLIGIVPFVKANWRAAALIGMLYLSILVPNSLHPAWYGGFSIVGRFWWAAVGLLIFPMAYTVRFLLKRRKLVLLLLCAVSIILQGWLAYKWLFRELFLVRRVWPIWAMRSFYEDTGALLLLPTFDSFVLYVRHPSNYVSVFFGLLLIFTGWLWQRGRIRLSGKIWALSLAFGIAIVAFVPPAIPSWRLAASHMGSQIGTLARSNRIFTEEDGAGPLETTSRLATEQDGVGTLAFGPYSIMLSGDYEVTVEYEYEHSTDTPAAHFDIVYGPQLTLVADVELPRSEMNNGVFRHRFTVRESQSLEPLFQFRIHYPGHGKLRLDWLTITPISLIQ